MYVILPGSFNKAARQTIPKVQAGRYSRIKEVDGEGKPTYQVPTYFILT